MLNDTDSVTIEVRELKDGNYRATLGDKWKDGPTPALALQALALSPGSEFEKVFSDE